MWGIFSFVIIVGSQVTHDFWARKLVERLGFQEALTPSSPSEEYFNLLSGRERVVIKKEFFSPAEERPYVYRAVISVKSPGRFVISGRANASSIITLNGKSFLLKKTAGTLPERAGVVLLPKGEHTLTISSFKKEPVEFLILDSSCFTPISPLRKWIKDAPLTFGDKASSIVRALDLEELLPQFMEAVEASPFIEGEKGGLEFVVKEKGVYSVMIESERKRRYENLQTETCGSYQIFTDIEGRGILFTRELEPGNFKIYGSRGIRGYLIRRRAREEEYVKILLKLGFPEKKHAGFVSEEEVQENLRSVPLYTEKKEVPPFPPSALVPWPEIPIPYRKSVSPLLPEFLE